MRITPVAVLLILSTEVRSDNCKTGSDPGNGLNSGKIYENAPPGTIATNITHQNDGRATYRIEGDLAIYFEMNGTYMQLKSSANLDRTEVGMPDRSEDIVITGTVLCKAGPGIGEVGSASQVAMVYVNQNPPEMTSPEDITTIEYTPIGAEVFTVEGNSGDDDGRPVTYNLQEQDHGDFFEISASSGVVTLKKDLDYNQFSKHTLTIELTDDGVDSNGDKKTRSVTHLVEVKIEDYDDLPPVFSACGTGSSPPFYTSNAETNTTGETLAIEPCNVAARDGDSGINASISYEISGGNSEGYFEIDSATGVISVKEVPEPKTFLLTLKALQDDNADKYSTAYLQIQASTKDEHKPSFLEKSYAGNVLNDGSDPLFVYDDSGELLQLQAVDDDDPDSVIVYVIDPSNSDFQISSDGFIFMRNSPTSRAVSPSTFTVKAINTNADPTSENRESDPVPVEVEITEVTTQATTMPTTQPTTEATTFEETTTLETTTESTTVEVTTFAPTTDMTTEPDTTTVEVTTLASTTDQTTMPDTTTVEVTTLASTPDQTTMPDTTTVEVTTLASTPDITSESDTTTVELSTVVSTLDITTESDTTTNQESTVASTVDQTTTSDITTQLLTTTKSTMEPTTTADITTPTTATTHESTTIKDATTASSTAVTSGQTQSTTKESTNQQTTDSGVISGEVEMVRASTLYGVAGGLSAALLIALLVIGYLLWEKYKKRKEDNDSLKSYPIDSTSDTQSHDGNVYENGTYVEENEVTPKAQLLDEETPTSFSSPYAHEPVTDLDAPSEHELDTGGSVTQSPYGFAEENPIEEDFPPVDETPTDPADFSLPTPNPSSFEAELKLAAAAAVTSAAVYKFVENDTTSQNSVKVEPSSHTLSADVVVEDELLKQDLLTTVKVVTLKGFGDEGEDVKGVLKSLDLSMATSADVERTKKKIAIMEQLSDMDQPNILKYYGSYEDSGELHYATAYAEKGTLQENLRSGEMTPNGMMHVMSGIGKGLQYLHAKNITHGKLTSKAVLLSADNTPMLTDIEGDSVDVIGDDEAIRWQAIEVVDQTSEASPASDVWSYGTVMWEIVSRGELPYSDVSDLGELPNRMHEQKLQRPKHCSESLFSIMSTCWNEDPKKRPDMYVINSNLQEKLLEDSNEHISMGLTDDSFANPATETAFDDLPSETDGNDSDADYTAF